MPTKNGEITTSNNMCIKKMHSKYHEGHHLDRKNFLFGQNGAPNIMLEDIMHAKKNVGQH